jgi:hypothetical protein
LGQGGCWQNPDWRRWFGIHIRPRFTQDLDFLRRRGGETRNGCRLQPHPPASFRHDGPASRLTSSPLPRSGFRGKSRRRWRERRSRAMACRSGGQAVSSERAGSSRYNRTDQTGRVDLSGFPLPAEKMSAFRQLVEAAATDPHRREELFLQYGGSV